MTTAQKQQAIDAFEELKALAPSVHWVMTWNYYTKLPEFTAMKDGGVKYDMYRRERREIVTQDNGIKYPRYTGEKYVELNATIDYSTRETENGVIVSGAHDWDKLPQANIRKELPRVSFKQYLEFVKNNLSILESIGA